MASENETIADIVAQMREHYVKTDFHDGDLVDATTAHHELLAYAAKLEAAWKREREEIVDAVSVLRDGMCLHCDMQQQCAEGEDGMSTTCNAMAIVNSFINRYKKLEVSDECPF